MLELLSCEIFCRRVECSEIVRAAGCKVVSFAHELGTVVQVAESSHGQISEGVVVRSVMLL